MPICIHLPMMTSWFWNAFEWLHHPGRRQAIIKTNAGILLIRALGTNFSEILSEIHIFSFHKVFENAFCKMTAILSRPQCVKTSQRSWDVQVVTWPVYAIGRFVKRGKNVGIRKHLIVDLNPVSLPEYLGTICNRCFLGHCLVQIKFDDTTANFKYIIFSAQIYPHSSPIDF